MTDSYRDRMNAENLANQAPLLQDKVSDILTTLKRLEQYVYWAIDPEEKDGGEYWATSLIERTHTLVDLAHEYRQALAANPPPKNSEIGVNPYLQFTR